MTTTDARPMADLGREFALTYRRLLRHRRYRCEHDALAVRFRQALARGDEHDASIALACAQAHLDYAHDWKRLMDGDAL
jgi:hypothetical protein